MLLAASCTPDHEDQPPNIVLLLVDTLRADHLSTYGYQRPTTPYIDSLGARGTVFEAAIAQSSWTAPSMASLWTSRLPSEVGVQAGARHDGVRNILNHSVPGLRDDATTLAEVLSNAGYTTIGVTANMYSSQKFSMLQGFSDNVWTGGNADVMFAKALERVEGRSDLEQPVFLYVHLVDVHHPTKPVAPYDRMFATLDEKPHVNLHSGWAFTRGKDLNTAAFRNFRSHKLALYDGALRFVDDQFKAFRADLERNGFDDNTIVVIASDHGEEFWDHVEFQCAQHLDPRSICGIGHGHSMSQEVLHVPLVFVGPGVPAGRVSQQVRNLDIAPTLLALAGVTDVPREMRGVDLFASQPPSLAISEDIAYGANARAIQDGVHKLVVYDRTRSGQTSFLFRWGSGSATETRETDDAIASRLAKALELSRRRSRKGPDVELDEETLRALRALGYAE